MAAGLAQRPTADVDVYAELSADGKSFLFEEYPEGEGPGKLWLAGPDPTAHVLLTDQQVPGNWYLARHGPEVYFLRRNQGIGDNVSATLTTANVRVPNGITDLAERIGDLKVIGGPAADLGVGALQDRVGQVGVLKVFLGSPPIETIVGSSTFQFAVSPDGRYTMFSPVEDAATQRRDARIADHAGSSVCALQRLPQTEIDTLDAFSENGELAFWYDYPDVTRSAGDGWMARTADCGIKQKFANRLAVHYAMRNAGLVFVDDYVDYEGVVRFLKWGPGMSWPASGAVTIQEGVNRELTILEPARKVALYTGRRPDNAGLYAVELPFD